MQSAGSSVANRTRISCCSILGMFATVSRWSAFSFAAPDSRAEVVTPTARPAIALEQVFGKLKPPATQKRRRDRSKASSPPSANCSQPTHPTNAPTTSKTQAMHIPDIITL